MLLIQVFKRVNKNVNNNYSKERFLEESTSFIVVAKNMQGVKVEEALMQRLEKESLRLANDIKEKEVENEVLREQIIALQSDIKKSNKMKDELSKVS